MVVVRHHAPGEDLKTVSLLGLGNEGFQPVRLVLVLKNMRAVCYPVVHMVYTTCNKNPWSTTHPLSPLDSVESS